MTELRWVISLLGALIPAVLVPRSPVLGPRPSSFQFDDVTAKSKITFVQSSGASPEKRMVETFGSGVAWIDYDDDGFPDLYFVNGAPGAPFTKYRSGNPSSS